MVTFVFQYFTKLIFFLNFVSLTSLFTLRIVEGEASKKLERARKSTNMRNVNTKVREFNVVRVFCSPDFPLDRT